MGFKKLKERKLDDENTNERGDFESTIKTLQSQVEKLTASVDKMYKEKPDTSISLESLTETLLKAQGAKSEFGGKTGKIIESLMGQEIGKDDLESLVKQAIVEFKPNPKEEKTKTNDLPMIEKLLANPDIKESYIHALESKDTDMDAHLNKLNAGEISLDEVLAEVGTAHENIPMGDKSQKDKYSFRNSAELYNRFSELSESDALYDASHPGYDDAQKEMEHIEGLMSKVEG